MFFRRSEIFSRTDFLKKARNSRLFGLKISDFPAFFGFFYHFKNFLKKVKKLLQKRLTFSFFCVIIIIVLREWRNWQTRTFEGRVVLPYGFNSRLPHQKSSFFGTSFFYPSRKAWYIIRPLGWISSRLWRGYHHALACIFAA